jgi:hypothetical protein
MRSVVIYVSVTVSVVSTVNPGQEGVGDKVGTLGAGRAW